MSNCQIRIALALFLSSIVTPNVAWANSQAERIGTQGAARYATERGWVKLLGARGRGISQGPDFVYLDPFSNRVRVIEAKGGSSQPKWTYGSRQGTNTNAIRSAQFVLKSARASQREKWAAALVIRAAQKKRLETGVVRTPHVLDKPSPPRLKDSFDRKNVGKEAFGIEREYRRNNPNWAKAFNGASAGQRAASLRYVATKGMRYAGRWFLPIAVGVEGLRMGGAYYDFSQGTISQRDLSQHSLGSMLFVTFTVGGGIVGGIPGAFVGAALAVPAEIAGGRILNRYYQKLNDEQTRLVNAAVYEHYGLDYQPLTNGS